MPCGLGAGRDRFAGGWLGERAPDTVAPVERGGVTIHEWNETLEQLLPHTHSGPSFEATAVERESLPAQHEACPSRGGGGSP
jgi:hypothetical protein